MIPQIKSLAAHSLSRLNFPTDLSIVEDCHPYVTVSNVQIHPISRDAFAELLGISRGRLVNPLLFGSVSIEYGISNLSRMGANYLTATDKNDKTVGAIGYTVDWANRWVKGIELIAESEEFFGALCAAFARTAEEELLAEGIEVNVSAYDARIQKTFYELGFRPVAYAPAMVFHGTKRLDVVKMLKLNAPYAPGEMQLTEPAREIVSLVEKHFLP
jgi:hypothetical protein